MDSLAYGESLLPMDNPNRCAEGLSDDRRREYRFRCSGRLFVQVVHCIEQPELEGRTQAGELIDASASGLHFRSEIVLLAGTLIDVWVNVLGEPGKFLLTGKVRWTEATATNARSVGVEFEDAAATDIIAWRALMH